MSITISEMIHFRNLNKMKLIAGEGGLDRIVTKCGILDYEYDPGVINKYYYTNFEEGQFILTTFLYAKDNEYLIFEALKRLINRKTSGLAIKNIFHIPLHSNFLRYADSKNFPVFLIEDYRLFFEDIIVTVAESIQSLSAIDYGATEADIILNGSLDDFALTRYAFQINHSLRSNLLTIYFRQKQTFPPEFYVELLDRYKKSALYAPSNSLFRYRNGLMFIYSCDMFLTDHIGELATEYIDLIAKTPGDFYIGVSNPHHSLTELKDAFRESLYAAIMHQSSSETYQLYKDLGTYRVILPFAQDPQMQAFSNQIIEPLLDYDTENKTKLTETAMQFVSCGGNLHKLARILSQHENTIRYRFDKMRGIIGLDIFKPDDYEKISTAFKIHLCKNLFHEFHEDIY